MVAVRMKELGAALGRLDDESLALLDLSLRRGMADEDIADVLRVDATEVAQRRDELLERLAGELKLEGREQRDELFATLPDLPDELWQGAQAAPA
jgi:DNA-directed RNA polymerase specialized sigma24 family protein